MSEAAFAYGRFLGALHQGAQQLLSSVVAGFAAQTHPARLMIEAAVAAEEAEMRVRVLARARRESMARFEASDPEGRLAALGVSIRAVAVRTGSKIGSGGPGDREALGVEGVGRTPAPRDAKPPLPTAAELMRLGEVSR